MAETGPRLKAEGTRPVPEEAQWIGLARAPRAAGRRPRLRLPKAPGLVTPGRSLDKPYRRADWIGKLAATRAKPDEVLDELERRLGRAPTESALREAALLLEEMSRLPDAQESLGRRVSQQAVEAVTKGKGVDRVD